MQMAADTARAAGLLEHRHRARELNFVQKQVLSPRRNQGDYAPVDDTGRPITYPEDRGCIFSAHRQFGCIS